MLIFNKHLHLRVDFVHGTFLTIATRECRVGTLAGASLQVHDAAVHAVGALAIAQAHVAIVFARGTRVTLHIRLIS